MHHQDRYIINHVLGRAKRSLEFCSLATEGTQEILGFHPSFSRHNKEQALCLWLNENNSCIKKLTSLSLSLSQALVSNTIYNITRMRVYNIMLSMHPCKGGLFFCAIT